MIKNTLRRVDKGSLFVFFAIIFIGLINIYSASIADNTHKFFTRQMIWIAIGIVIGFIIFKVNYSIWEKYSYPIYFFALILLVVVYIFSPTIKGAHRWLVLGPISLQPSEFAKFTTIMALAYYLSNKKQSLDFKSIIIPLLIITIPFLMILIQPDLGTAGTLMLIGVGMLLVFGLRLRFFIFSLITGFAGIFVLYDFILKDYQRRRLTTFLNPEKDPLGAGYHIIQSKIAIGSGGFWGKGFLKGTQTQLSFLPEQHTDFVFSVFAEEWGAIGVSLILFLYLILFLWGISVAKNSKDQFGKFLATGIVLHLFIHFIINLAMITGAFPVVGIPLPFLSYGGSSLLVLFLEMGLLFNIQANRFMF